MRSCNLNFKSLNWLTRIEEILDQSCHLPPMKFTNLSRQHSGMRVSALYATEKSSCMKQENVQITIEENCSTAKITIIPSMSSHPLGQSHSRLVTCMSILFQFSTVIMEMPGLRPLIRRTSSANLSLRPTMDRQICQPLD